MVGQLKARKAAGVILEIIKVRTVESGAKRIVVRNHVLWVLCAMTRVLGHTINC